MGAYHDQTRHRHLAVFLHVRIRYRDRDCCRKLAHLSAGECASVGSVVSKPVAEKLQSC
jgi:hypothetical protein